MSTPKEIAKRIKAKGLQKLRWYCQMCQKQCRDENGFKCHCMSESHLRQMNLFAENPQKYVEQYSREFLNEFMKVLSQRHQTKRVLANQVYQEFIQDRHHLHMNSTKWETLTDFVKWMGRERVCEVDETPRGWFIAWIDRSPKALERAAAEARRARQDADDEAREKRLLEEQVQRATETRAAATAAPESPEPQHTELRRDAEAAEPIRLSLNMKSAPKPAVAASAFKRKGKGRLEALAESAAKKQKGEKDSGGAERKGKGKESA